MRSNVSGEYAVDIEKKSKENSWFHLLKIRFLREQILLAFLWGQVWIMDITATWWVYSIYIFIHICHIVNKSVTKKVSCFNWKLIALIWNGNWEFLTCDCFVLSWLFLIDTVKCDMNLSTICYFYDPLDLIESRQKSFQKIFWFLFVRELRKLSNGQIN